jgi:hypothetical protein
MTRRSQVDKKLKIGLIRIARDAASKALYKIAAAIAPKGE